MEIQIYISLHAIIVERNDPYGKVTWTLFVTYIPLRPFPIQSRRTSEIRVIENLQLPTLCKKLFDNNLTKKPLKLLNKIAIDFKTIQSFSLF